MSYAGAIAGNAPARVDMRSDTVTRPTGPMIEAMMSAELGDDVYGDDPSVNALQEKVAGILGKEAALFVSSGTQSNLCAMMAHCQRGEEIITGDGYHVFVDEAGGASVLGGVMFAPVRLGEDGTIGPEDIDRAIKPDDVHCPISRLLTLENTWNGRVISLEDTQAAARHARSRGLSVHFDGARMMNACVRLGIKPRKLAKEMDTVSVCLSKGLGAPAGSVLAGSHEVIARANRVRKILGGGMRQAGIFAAAGIYALDNHVERLAKDHDNAIRLADQLCGIKVLEVDMDSVQSNMVFAGLPQKSAAPLQKHLGARGILINAGEPTIRLVTHLDCGADEVDIMAAEIKGFFA